MESSIIKRLEHPIGVGVVWDLQQDCARTLLHKVDPSVKRVSVILLVEAGDDAFYLASRFMKSLIY